MIWGVTVFNAVSMSRTPHLCFCTCSGQLSGWSECLFIEFTDSKMLHSHQKQSSVFVCFSYRPLLTPITVLCLRICFGRKSDSFSNCSVGENQVTKVIIFIFHVSNTNLLHLLISPALTLVPQSEQWIEFRDCTDFETEASWVVHSILLALCDSRGRLSSVDQSSEYSRAVYGLRARIWVRSHAVHSTVASNRPK